LAVKVYARVLTDFGWESSVADLEGILRAPVEDISNND